MTYYDIVHIPDTYLSGFLDFLGPYQFIGVLITFLIFLILRLAERGYERRFFRAPTMSFLFYVYIYAIAVFFLTLASLVFNGYPANAKCGSPNFFDWLIAIVYDLLPVFSLINFGSYLAVLAECFWKRETVFTVKQFVKIDFGRPREAVFRIILLASLGLMIISVICGMIPPKVSLSFLGG